MSRNVWLRMKAPRYVHVYSYMKNMRVCAAQYTHNILGAQPFTGLLYYTVNAINYKIISLQQLFNILDRLYMPLIITSI